MMKFLFCKHAWHHVDEHRECISYCGSSPTFKMVVTAFCPKCNKLKEMNKSKFEQIKKIEEIKKQWEK